MSRITKNLSEHVSIAFGDDHALGSFFQVFDERYPDFNEEESDVIFDYSEKFGICENILNMTVNVKGTIDFEKIVQMCDLAHTFGYNIMVINPGDTVVCDSCGKDYTDSDEEGGFVFSSNAYCPDCEPRMMKSIEMHGEEKFINARCPAGMSFKDFILNYRKIKQ